MNDHNHKPEVNNLFERYLENRCEPGEVRVLLDHFSEVVNEAELRGLVLEAMVRPVDTAFEQSPEGQRLFEEVHRNIRRAISRRERSTHRMYTLWPKVAAAAAVVLIAGFLWMWMGTPETAAMLEITTGNSERQEVTLPDGTVVFLNAGSEFAYPDRFLAEDGIREVFLRSGEAYFEVTPDPDRPFQILAGETAVQVLGTSFNVKAYREDESSRVAVRSGEVEVRFGPSQAVLLRARQQAVWEKPEQRILRSVVDSGDVGAWIENRMVFANETLAEVFRVLERQYDVEIGTERPGLLEERVTLKLNEQPLQDIMEVLRFTKDFEFEFNAEENAIIVK